MILLQATFGGSTLGNLRGFHFSQQDFEAMGHHFLDALLEYCDPDPTKVSQVQNNRQSILVAKLTVVPDMSRNRSTKQDN